MHTHATKGIFEVPKVVKYWVFLSPHIIGFCSEMMWWFCQNLTYAGCGNWRQRMYYAAYSPFWHFYRIPLWDWEKGKALRLSRIHSKPKNEHKMKWRQFACTIASFLQTFCFECAVFELKIDETFSERIIFVATVCYFIISALLTSAIHSQFFACLNDLLVVLSWIYFRPMFSECWRCLQTFELPVH